MQLAGVVQAMVELVYPNANIQQNWQLTMLVFVFVFLTVGFNVFVRIPIMILDEIFADSSCLI